MRRASLILLIALVAAGCGAAEPTQPRSTGVRAGELLQVRDGDGTVRAIDVRSGREAGRRPLGVRGMIAGHDVVYSVRPSGSGTAVEARDAATGAVRAQRTLPGRWRLPEPAADGTLEGVSADGGTLVLTRESRFAFLDAALAAPPQVAALDARFSYDALSPDGSVLYLVEHRSDLGPRRYQVRAFERATGRMRAGAIVDTREIDEPMAGYPLARATSSDGAWVYTLYQGPEHAFVHALAAADGYALCIDLPGGVPRRRATVSYWGLALAGDTLYAANASLGVAAAINGPNGEIDRSGRLPKQPAQAAPPAAGARVVLAADGRTLYALGPEGLLAIDAASLAPRDRLLAGEPLAGLAISPDARRVYAADPATRAVLAVDARTGRRLGSVAGVDGTLLGVVRAGS
jgi:hypothetical protein